MRFKLRHRIAAKIIHAPLVVVPSTAIVELAMSSAAQTVLTLATTNLTAMLAIPARRVVAINSDFVA